MTRAMIRPAAASMAVRTHSRVEDVAGLLTGTFMASFGLFLLKAAGAVTGGTAGIALLLSYVTPVTLGSLFFVVNLPFLVLGLLRKGVDFAVRTLICITLVSAFAFLHPAAITALSVDPVFGVLTGNLLAGVGILIVFRHHASLGGLSVIALIAQERVGLRAGYVQLCFDVVIIAVSLLVVPPQTAALSAAGAVVLNLVLALNHRPGRYTA